MDAAKRVERASTRGGTSPDGHQAEFVRIEYRGRRRILRAVVAAPPRIGLAASAADHGPLPGGALPTRDAPVYRPGVRSDRGVHLARAAPRVHRRVAHRQW